jgi:hypothetical protein
VRPLSVGVMKQVNHQSTQLSHRLNRSGSMPGSDGSASVDGSADGGGVARDGVSEVGGVVVHGAGGPWGRPRGLIEILAV